MSDHTNHLSTAFTVTWQDCGSEEKVEKFIRKQEAIKIAEIRSMNSWQGTAIVDMIISENCEEEQNTRIIRSWEVSPETCIQIYGPKERVGYRK